MGIVLLPSSGKQSVKRFEDTILHGIPKKTVIKNTYSPAVLEAVNSVPGDSIAVWGFVEKTNNHNATKWKKIRPGDTVLFYAKHRLNYTGTIVAKEDNAELSNILWGEESPGNTWNLIFYIDDLVQLSGIEFKPSVLGYEENYVLQAALVIEDDDPKYNRFVDYYGDLLYVEKDDDSELTTVVMEGERKAYYGTKYERQRSLRERAIKIHKCKCQICGFDFEEKYGELGRGFIEVHHIVPLYAKDGPAIVNPETDLICICANCHRMIHHKKNAILTPDELRRIVSRV